MADNLTMTVEREEVKTALHDVGELVDRFRAEFGHTWPDGKLPQDGGRMAGMIMSLWLGCKRNGFWDA